MAVQQRIEQRQQRRALAARGDIARAEIGGDGAAGARRDHRGCAELQRRARAPGGNLMVHRLAVRGHQINRFERQAAGGSSIDRRRGECFTNQYGKLAHVGGRAGGGREECVQPFAHGGRVGSFLVAEQFERQRVALALEAHDGSIDRVGRGAGHEADDDHECRPHEARTTSRLASTA
jgi:hypothetical protein